MGPNDALPFVNIFVVGYKKLSEKFSFGTFFSGRDL